MCSINLVFSHNESSAKLRKFAFNMANSTIHRGPDSTEVISKRNFALAFNRLEIVGGAQGTQPISNESNQIHLICNGEIFNYKELMKKHKQKHVYKTTSDVEVILHLYEEYGSECIKLLEGQFAFTIIDEDKKKIVIGRDRFGINPLFYHIKEDSLFVASEIKAICNSGFIESVSLDPEAIAESWFFYGAIPPKTAFQDIFQLPPASLGIYNMNNSKLNIASYWIVKEEEGKANGLDKILNESVKKRLQGKSKPGVYASGGLDSSIIAFLVNKLSKTKPELFSIAFKNKKFDESEFQDQLADYLNCRLHKVYVDTEKIISNLKKGVMHTETPLIRSAPIPMMLLSKEARKKGIKFVLCGEGSDELFLGYPVFLKGKSSIEEKWEDNTRYLKYFVDPTIATKIVKKYKKLTIAKNDSKSLEIRKREVETKLSQYLLTNQGDRMSMANSVEQRFPFLDMDVVSYALSAKKDILVKDNVGKDILRKTYASALPKELVMRKKQGYLTPDVDVAIELLKDQHYRKLLSEDSIKKLNIFNFSEVNNLINSILTPEVHEPDARFLLFIVTTQLLEDIFKHHKADLAV